VDPGIFQKGAEPGGLNGTEDLGSGEFQGQSLASISRLRYCSTFEKYDIAVQSVTFTCRNLVGVEFKHKILKIQTFNGD